VPNLIKFAATVLIAIGSVLLMTPVLVSLFGFILIFTVLYGVLIKPMLRRWAKN
jgi:UPF0716 family protein affecting phage T7 exclusion